MTKKDIIFLLLPSAFLAAMAALSLFWASALLPDSQDTQWTEKRDEELVRKAQSGEVSPDKLVRLLRASRHSRDELHETLGVAHAKLSRVLGYGVLFGVALQIYVIFRVRSALRKHNA